MRAPRKSAESPAILLECQVRVCVCVYWWYWGRWGGLLLMFVVNLWHCVSQTHVAQTEQAVKHRIARDAWNGHSPSLKVIRCYSSRPGIYDFLLALDSNVTSIFNRSWDITPSLHINNPALFQMELEKDGWEYVDMLWCHCAQNIGLSNHKLKSALKYTIWSQCTVSDGQTHGQTDRRTNIMAIARWFILTNASRANKVTYNQYVFHPKNVNSLLYFVF